MEIPASVTSVGSEAFCIWNDTWYRDTTTIPSFITKLTFAEGSQCTSICQSAFSYSLLTTIKFNSTLQTIGESAFAYSSKLASVDFPSSLSFINQRAFSECPKLEIVNLSSCANLSSIGYYAFGYCESLISVDLSKCINLTSIDSDVFYYCTSLKSVKIASSLELIGQGAFIYCSALTSADLSNATNLSFINNCAFWGCSSLTSVSFPSSLTKIETNVFKDCPNLSSITWDRWTGSIDSLADNAFSGVCPTGGNVIVTNPSGSHDSAALLDCLLKNGGLPQSWAKDVVNPLPEDVYVIENNVLKGFTTEFLTNPTAYDTYNTMEIPARVTSIADRAFWGEYGFVIPNFITKLTFAEGSHCSLIGEDAFCNCPLTSIDLSNCRDLTSITNYAFEICSALTSVLLPNNLTSIGIGVFTGCSTLTSVSLPSNLESIGGYAFYNCSSLTSDGLSECINLTSIGDRAFANCLSLTSVSFPSSLQRIGTGAFADCHSLEEIIWNNLNSAPTIGSESFLGVANTGHVKSTGSYISSQLLSLLKQQGELPSGWGSS